MALDQKNIGSQAEGLACDYLKKAGFLILAKNYLIRGGEIDIVAKEDGVLVFIEVKARLNYSYGLPIESITPWKIKALKKTALFYIQKVKWVDNPYRFDLVTVDYSSGEPKIELIRNIIEGM